MYRGGRAADNRGGRLGLGTETFARRAGQGRAARPEVVPPAVVVHEGDKRGIDGDRRADNDEDQREDRAGTVRNSSGVLQPRELRETARPDQAVQGRGFRLGVVPVMRKPLGDDQRPDGPYAAEPGSGKVTQDDLEAVSGRAGARDR